MDWIRIWALSIGALILISPLLSWRPKKKPSLDIPDVTQADLAAVLTLATRLRSLGCKEGVSLCQQLLNVMLNHKIT